MADAVERGTVVEQRLSNGSCFIPGGVWNPKHIPIYNPSNQLRKVLVVIGDSAGQVSVTEIPVSAKSVASVDGSNGYALVDELP